MRAAHGQLRHGADLLALHVERPALRHLAGAEGGGQGVRRRVPAAEAAQVHGVPLARVLRVPDRAAVRGQGLGHGRQVRGRGQQRRVVRVVRGAEEDRLRVRRDGGQLGRRPRGGSWCAAPRRQGSTSWRCMSGAMATGGASSGASAGTRTRSPRGRWRRTRPTRRGGTPSARRGLPTGSRPTSASQVGGIHRVERAADGPQGSGSGLRRRRVTVGRRTGRFAGQWIRGARLRG